MTLEAAQIAGVAPWDMERQPMVWQNRILTAAELKAQAEEFHRKQAERRQRQRRPLGRRR